LNTIVTDLVENDNFWKIEDWAYSYIYTDENKNIFIFAKNIFDLVDINKDRIYYI